jgi:acetyl-CoA carboxylase biotin carboxyl carrier protein
MGDKKQKSSPPPVGGEGVDLAEVERLLDFMEKHGLEEFEYERGGFRIRLKKPGAHALPRHSAVPEILVANPGPATEAPPAAAPVREASAEGARSDDLHVVKSPIVGTFYESPAPEAPAFVRVGERVQPGKVLCIIESMKLMNEIEAEVSGILESKLVMNGQPVEYGEALFAIRTV